MKNRRSEDKEQNKSRSEDKKRRSEDKERNKEGSESRCRGLLARVKLKTPLIQYVRVS